LAPVVSPVDPAGFLEHFRARRHFHVARNAPHYYADLLTEESLNELFQSERLPASFVHLVKDGIGCPLEDWSHVAASERREQRVADPERIPELFAGGATIVLNQLERVVPSLNAACRALSVETGLPAWANIYIAPAGSVGFSRHVDSHEVLILQIDGHKQWLLYPGEGPTLEIEMRAGDLLYLPGGLAHSARAQESESIHVTLGLRPAYAFDLIAELARVAEESADFSQPMPPRFAGDVEKREFEADLLRRLRDMISKTSPAELVERRFRSLVERQPQGPARPFFRHPQFEPDHAGYRGVPPARNPDYGEERREIAARGVCGEVARDAGLCESRARQAPGRRRVRRPGFGRSYDALGQGEAGGGVCEGGPAPYCEAVNSFAPM
jgi:ribosomal protein L16 Arg81 hydroxylase